MPLVEYFFDAFPLKTTSSEGVPVGVNRPQPVGHGVEWSVPICRCGKKTFSISRSKKFLYAWSKKILIKKTCSIY
jgi:hypothetical protein